MAAPQLVLRVEAADVDVVRAVGELLPLRLRVRITMAPRASSSAQLTPPPHSPLIALIPRGERVCTLVWRHTALRWRIGTTLE